MNEPRLYEAIHMMIKTNHMHKALIDSRMSSLGIHRTHHWILMHLAKQGKLPSQKELADHLDITPAAVTVALQKMEKDGYVERTLGQDNRFNEIRITERGKEMVMLSREIFCQVDSSMFEGFSEDDLNNYISCLERLQANIKRQNERKENK